VIFFIFTFDPYFVSKGWNRSFTEVALMTKVDALVYNSGINMKPYCWGVSQPPERLFSRILQAAFVIATFTSVRTCSVETMPLPVIYSHLHRHSDAPLSRPRDSEGSERCATPCKR
jgi:hypothetical protein